MQYDFKSIEKRWQNYWQQNKTFHVPNPGEDGFDNKRPGYYVLDMFPYPSGVGLHVGHPLGYIATDVIARYKKMNGYNVLHPIGYDAFGLPAEQYAIETGVHPKETTQKNIANMTHQLKRLGIGYDWDRTISTTDPDYYKWTQWIFLQLFNSWFDEAQNKARPISDLLWMLDSERLYVSSSGDLVVPSALGMDAISGPPVGARKWFELDEYEQRQVIDNQRLAYMGEAEVNWCPKLGTVLANEEVTNEGKSERGNYPVYKRPLKQWMLRITAYCQRLLEDLEKVDWPNPIKIMQRNWIGKSTGAKVDFPILNNEDKKETGETIEIFTTRPDTLFGATYMVLAPEHELTKQITTTQQRDKVNKYIETAKNKTSIERQAEKKNKTGVFTGGFALNPLTNEQIPVWIADYVMTDYGSGAIMAVPAHDKRDFDFAKQFDLNIKPVIMPSTHWLQEHSMAEAGDKQTIDDISETYLEKFKLFDTPFTGNGKVVNSTNNQVSIDGLTTSEAREKIIIYLQEQGLGRKSTQYKLRDWLFSRQRYWGEPFPILHGEDGEIVALDESELPLELPEVDQFKPRNLEDPNQPPQPPLANSPFEWQNVTIDGKKYKRELNTMPQWAGSCWYYLRYLDPKNVKKLANQEAEKYWMSESKALQNNTENNNQAQDKSKLNSHPGVDLYVGGAEHAVLHLLYARFWHKVLYDLGHVSTIEPFGSLFNQGYIQAYAYTDSRGVYVPAEQVEERKGKFFYNDQEVKQEFGKMGKSLKNAISPDEIGKEYGFDTLRLYEMYLGPLEQSKVWNTRDIVGVHRFLQRLWRNFIDQESGELLISDEKPDTKLLRKLHKTIARVTEAMETLSFNVAIAALIELNNELVAFEKIPKEAALILVRCLAPLAPHISEELWEKLGQSPSVSSADWPKADANLLIEDKVEYPVQINGKLRTKIELSTRISIPAIEQTALEHPEVVAALGNQKVHKIIVVPNRMINIVVDKK